MSTLWDTTGTAVVKALQRERRAAGSVASGMALTLVIVADEPDIPAAEAAATVAASAHPCRLLLVVRRQLDSPLPRLDAEVLIGGRLGPGEAVVMRMHGRLGLHAESVVLPLLAPDAPVVTWWYGVPPELIANDPLGVLAERRVTDSRAAPDPLAALQQRASDYAIGDTDLAWTEVTSWRAVLASAYDSVTGRVSAASVAAPDSSPAGVLLAAWLACRLGVPAPVSGTRSSGIEEVTLEVDGGAAGGGTTIQLTRDSERTGRLSRNGQPDRSLPLPRRDMGDLLAEELRRLDHDAVYAEALGQAFNLDLSHRPDGRTHIWRDPVERAAAAG